MARWIERLARNKLKVGVGAFVLMVVFGVVSVEVTSQSWFCNSCHIMNPYYESWAAGTHKDVACVKCHISPGVDNFMAAKLNGLGQVVDDVLHRTSNKPSASVEQVSCTRSGCHSVEKLTSREINNGKFKFPHSKHLGNEVLGVAISCGTCHSHVKGDKHFEVSTSVCITCHMIERQKDSVQQASGTLPSMVYLAVREHHPIAADAQIAAVPPTDASRGSEKLPPTNCTACHEPPEKEIERNGVKIDHKQFLGYGAACESCHRGVTATPPPIDDGRCLECHTFGVERAMTAKEMHQTHSLGRHKIECTSCHGVVRHGPQFQTASLEQFDCRQCHIEQHAVQRSGYFAASGSAADTSGTHGAAAVSPMFLTHVDCTGCHIKPAAVSSKPMSGAHVRVAVPEACDQCHKPGLGAKMIPLWQRNTHEQHEKLTKELRAAQSAGTISDQAAQDASHLLDLIKADGSWGVHNPGYTQQLFDRIRGWLGKGRTPEGDK